MKRSQRPEVKTVITRVEKDFRSRKSNSLPRGRLAPSSQGRETSPQLETPQMELQTKPQTKRDWFGPQPIGKRKHARPFEANSPMEVKFTSRFPDGRWSFSHPSNRKRIRSLLRAEAARNSVRLNRVSLKSEGTLLIELETKERAHLSRFLRVLAGRIPRVVTGAERGRPLDGLARTPGARAPGARSFWAGLVSSRCLPVTRG